MQKFCTVVVGSSSTKHHCQLPQHVLDAAPVSVRYCANEFCDVEKIPNQQGDVAMCNVGGSRGCCSAFGLIFRVVLIFIIGQLVRRWNLKRAGIFGDNPIGDIEESLRCRFRGCKLLEGTGTHFLPPCLKYEPIEDLHQCRE
jgi:hypothetical protein